jgi:hypothetical protein
MTTILKSGSSPFSFEAANDNDLLHAEPTDQPVPIKATRSGHNILVRVFGSLPDENWARLKSFISSRL